MEEFCSCKYSIPFRPDGSLNQKRGKLVCFMCARFIKCEFSQLEEDQSQEPCVAEMAFHRFKVCKKHLSLLKR